MPSIEYYTVIKPPTGREVLEDALASIISKNPLNLVMISESDITPADHRQITVDVSIRTTSHTDGEQATITGTTPLTQEIGSIVLSVPNSNLPATADVVNR